MSAPLDPSAFEAHLDEALRLAAAGRFRVEPNPTVGAVVLDREGRMAGSGAHLAFGGPHAEAAALDDACARGAGERIRGGTIVVSLEPCSHVAKKTPPCAPKIVAAGLTRVVAGAADENPATSGGAARVFAAAGIEYGIVPADSPAGGRCRAAIARYTRHFPLDRPWVVAKWAMSVDGRTADSGRGSRWISGEASRGVVHALRESADAVVVGVGTVLADDPDLTSHRPGARRGTRVVFDSHLRIPLTARLVATARETPTILFCRNDVDAARRGAMEAAGAAVIPVDAGIDGRIEVTAAFRALRGLGVRRALLEAGGTLQAACLRASIVDQVTAFVAPVLIGGSGPSPFQADGWPIGSAPRLEEVRVTSSGPDALIEGYWPAGR